VTCIKKFKAKQARKGKAFMKPSKNGEQHFNVLSKGTKREEDFILDEYCGYDVGNEFHQSNNQISFNDDYRNTRVGDTMIFLDSQSTQSTFYVRRLVRNIREAPRPLKMVTNAGTIVYTKQADLPHYGTVWFNGNSIANIISMSEAERKGHKISFTPGCITLTNATNGRKTDFKITLAGLCAFEISIDESMLFKLLRKINNCLHRGESCKLNRLESFTKWLEDLLTMIF
jgi:hypothetical protein